MARYIGIVDGENGTYGIVFPDLPGCTSMGTTVDQVARNAIEAVRMWVEDATEDGEPIPEARTIDDLLRDEEVRKELGHGAVLVAIPLLMDSGRPAKANISLDAGLLKAIDEAAEAHNLTRSAFIATAAREKIESEPV
jgi:predicted RNase H-like HicB family nuclease